MNRSLVRCFALILAIVATTCLTTRPVGAGCDLDSGVRLVNGKAVAIDVTVTDSCEHVVKVTVPAGEYVAILATSGRATIRWGSSGENTPDLSRGQVYVQQL